MLSRNFDFFNVFLSLGDTFPSYADRCGSCVGEPESQVCGSDGKTYRYVVIFSFELNEVIDVIM